MIIKLTDNEWGILEHRLDIHDCIADCYAATMYSQAADSGKKMTDAQHKAAYDAADEAGHRLNCDIRKTRQIDSDKLTDLDKFILADCLDGSTFFSDCEDAVSWGDWTHQKLNALMRSASALERKFNEAGIECRMNF
jgi:hypothetical protein